MSKPIKFHKNISVECKHKPIQYIYDLDTFILENQEFIDMNKCPHHPLEIYKTCQQAIRDDGFYLEYAITIYNSTECPIYHLRFLDKLLYDQEHIDIGTIAVSPDTVRISREYDGVILFSDRFQCLEPKTAIKINYTLPLAFTESGSYPFTNTAKVKSKYYHAKALCDITVQLPSGCQGIPVSNRSCLTNSYYSIVQPHCQFTEAMQSIPNPYYDANHNRSYWTIELLVNCLDESDLYPSALLIPIPATVAPSILQVNQRILSVEQTRQVPFEIVTLALPDQQKTKEEENILQEVYLSIPVDNDYTSGVGVYYQLVLIGAYPEATSSIDLLLDGGATISFPGDYVTPGEPTEPRISITKDAHVIIDGDKAFIDYTVSITNNGNTDLTDIFYTDTINYDTSVSIGFIEVIPPSVVVDTSMPGIIRLTDTFDSLMQGETQQIVYRVPVTFSEPNSYNFVSNTMAMNQEVRQGISTEVTIDVVMLLTDNICRSSGQQGAFNIRITNAPDSPTTAMSLVSTLVVPAHITVQFTSFDICEATFQDGSPVPLNTDITNATILLRCSSLVPANASMNYIITLVLQSISSNLSGTPIMITNTLNQVNLTTNNQVYLGAVPLPNEAKLISNVDVTCQNTCNKATTS